MSSPELVIRSQRKFNAEELYSRNIAHTTQSEYPPCEVSTLNGKHIHCYNPKCEHFPKIGSALGSISATQMEQKSPQKEIGYVEQNPALAIATKQDEQEHDKQCAIYQNDLIQQAMSRILDTRKITKEYNKQLKEMNSV